MNGEPPKTEPAREEAAPSKRVYVKPRLTKLGSVRELTLGSNAGFAEGAGTFRMM